MNFQGDDVEVKQGSTSYFSNPASELDPHLFQGTHLRPWVRNGVLRMLFDHLAVQYNEPHKWVLAWLAGSGVSFQWKAVREPADLDCLVGINYMNFRRFNTDYSGMTDEEIAKMFNDGFNDSLMPETENWEGYELTYYVNPQTDIRSINPYAAYDLINDRWTVEPNKNSHVPHLRAWEEQTRKDYQLGVSLVKNYSRALTEYKGSVYRSPSYANAEAKLKLAIDQAADFYEELHHNRTVAFSPTGAGYQDFNNYRWQAGKSSGIIPALKQIKEYRDESKKSEDLDTYGVELPDTNLLIRRALAHRSNL